MIKEFKDEFAWLSNFEPCEIVLGEMKYPSVEHAYMSAKSDNFEWKKFCSNPINSAGKVKRESRKIELVENWDSIKIPVMIFCIRQKFNQEPFRTKLLQTGDEYLQEGNWWNDDFWGFCFKSNAGQNILGKLIMNHREFLKETSKI